VVARLAASGFIVMRAPTLTNSPIRIGIQSAMYGTPKAAWQRSVGPYLFVPGVIVSL